MMEMEERWFAGSHHQNVVKKEVNAAMNKNVVEVCNAPKKNMGKERLARMFPHHQNVLKKEISAVIT